MASLMTGAQLESERAPVALRGITIRSLIYGTLLSGLLAALDPYVAMVCSGWLCANATPVGAVFLFAVAVFIFNMLLRGLDNLCGGHSPFGWLKLRASELIIVYIMMLAASAIPTFGFSESFFSILGGPAHNASDTNAWSEKIMPHINPNIVPFDPAKMAGVEKGVRDLEPDHIRWLYEGMPGVDEVASDPRVEAVRWHWLRPFLVFGLRVKAIPWGPWVRPFLVWMVLIFSFYFVLMCIISILRKQWMERERLQYPLAQLPMAMVEEADVRKGVPALFRNKLLWIGFAIPMFLTSWNSLAQFFQLVTPIPQTTRLYLLNRQMEIGLGVDWPVIGFAYLIKLEVALSLWLFSFLGAVVGATFSNLGIKAGSQDLWLDRPHDHPLAYHACFGAVILLGVLTLWAARRSIWEVIRKACGARDVDDSGRSAAHCRVLLGRSGRAWRDGVVASAISTGMSLWFAAVFLVVALLGLLAATRLIAEGGLVFVQFPMMVQSFLFRIIVRRHWDRPTS